MAAQVAIILVSLDKVTSMRAFVHWWANIFVSTKIRVTILGAGSSLAFAFARHRMVLWDSVGAFLVYWFIHYVALVLIAIFSGAAILRFQKFFVGYEPHTEIRGELEYYIYMTVLVGSVLAMVVMSTPVGDW